MTQTATRRFHRLCLATLVAVYVLILVGGVVRATGAGMGCPDWPTCFGQWIPPTRVEQLPLDYKEQFAKYRDQKNKKFAKYLSLIGLDQTAGRILADKSILVEEDFNPAKTLIEYVNRLVGVGIGLLIMSLCVASWSIRHSTPGVYIGSWGLLILVIFQGWFGSIVVSTNLTAWTITTHMFLAIVMVGLLVWLWVRSGGSQTVAHASVKPWLVGGIVALLVQIFLGTQVREALDSIVSGTDRQDWIRLAGSDFVIHRSFSWVIVLLQIGIYFKLRKTSKERALYLVPIVLILCSVLTGSAMAYFSVPALMQPIHLVVAVVTIGWLFQVYLQANNRAENVLVKQ